MHQLVCFSCRRTYDLDEPHWRCECGGLLDIPFQPVLDIKKIAGCKPGMWRYRAAIPLKDDSHIISFDEGYTPLLQVEFGGRSAWIKQDHLFPTGSYKDRGASVMVSKIVELGIKDVVEDSSGNAGCAVAAYCARASIACEIFVPDSTSPGKLTQIRHYGARLNLVPGSREDTARAVFFAAQTRYYASHSWNPFFLQGTKTFAYEVCEQLGWRAPDAVVIPVGNGTLLLGAAIGFEELLQAGIIKTYPRLIAVQAEGCAPLAQAFHANEEEPRAIGRRETLAEGIAIAEPVRGQQIIRAVHRSQGTFLEVNEQQIIAALYDVNRRGYYIEPTAAAAAAGLFQYLQSSQKDEVVVSVFTGHGLKSTEKLMKIDLYEK